MSLVLTKAMIVLLYYRTDPPHFFVARRPLTLPRSFTLHSSLSFCVHYTFTFIAWTGYPRRSSFTFLLMDEVALAYPLRLLLRPGGASGVHIRVRIERFPGIWINLAQR